MMNIVKIIFPLIVLPYMTHVLSVETYGVVAYEKAVMQYMIIFVDFGFLLSGTKDIALSKGKGEKLYFEIGNIFLARMFLCLVAFFALLAMICVVPILRQNILYTILAFLAVFLSCFLMEFVFRGIEHMELISIPFIVMKSISTILTFVFVKSDSDILWIPVLDVLGTFVAVFIVLFFFYKLGLKLKFGSYREIYNKLKNSAVYFFSNMATTAFTALNTLLIGMFIQASEVAYWSLCVQMIGAAQSLYTPVIDGIYPHMVKTRDLSVVKRTFKIFMPVVISGCIFTIFVAKYALAIIGGIKYMVAAPLLRILVLVLLFSFPSMMLGWPVLGAVGKEKQVTYTTVFTAVFQVVGLIVLIVFNLFDLMYIAVLRGISEFVLFITRYYFVKKYENDFVNN